MHFACLCQLCRQIWQKSSSPSITTSWDHLLRDKTQTPLWDVSKEECSRSDSEDLSWTSPGVTLTERVAAGSGVFFFFSADGIKLLSKHLTTSAATEMIQSDRWWKARKQQQRVRKAKTMFPRDRDSPSWPRSATTCMLFIGKTHACYFRAFITAGASFFFFFDGAAFDVAAWKNKRKAAYSLLMPSNVILMWNRQHSSATSSFAAVPSAPYSSVSH